MMDVSGFTLTETEKTNLDKPSIGGVILFTRNYQDIHQIRKLIGEIRMINPDLLIAVDHEGGRVQRFREGFTHLPAMAKLGQVYDKYPEHAVEQAFSCGWILAAELLAIDVDFSFTPVLDLDYGKSLAIGDRAFHSNPEVVIELAGSLIKGLHEAGMKCVGKHFPGHGHVEIDSHIDLPIDERSMNEIEYDILCFKGLINKGLDAVMPAHVLYPQVDDKPSSFSSIWIKEILKTQSGFGGIVFTDDLSMQGAHFIKNITERVYLSLESGCDMALICNHPELVTEVIDLDWPNSEKLQLMKGIKPQEFNKMVLNHHINNIQSLF